MKACCGSIPATEITKRKMRGGIGPREELERGESWGMESLSLPVREEPEGGGAGGERRGNGGHGRHWRREGGEREEMRLEQRKSNSRNEILCRSAAFGRR
jgi:hypothetical protein